MSLKLPAGHGSNAMPFKHRNLFKDNLPITIRECHANAITFGAKNSHVVRLQFPNGDLFLLYMHDGKPFEGGVEEIKTLGLTPNNSSNTGWSFQGNGLTYCASYLCQVYPKLIIASKGKGGKIVSASAIVDYKNNDWIIEEEPDFGQDLKEILGTKWIDKMNVFYLFRLPDSEKGVNESYGMKYHNDLAFLAPKMIKKRGKDNLPKLTASEGVFFIGKTNNDGKEYKSLSDCPGGSWDRHTISMEEYFLRLSENQWTFETEEFSLKKDNWIYNVRAEITISACPGLPSLNKDGTDNHQWLGNVRDGEFNGCKFKKHGGVGYCIKPKHSVYLYVPVVANGENENAERFSRFKDNAVWLSSASHYFGALGLNYNERQKTAKADGKPFAIMQVKITHIDSEMKSAISDETIPVNPIYFTNAFGRRADFLFDGSASNDILNATINAAALNVPDDCRKWFSEKFPSQAESRVPIIVGDQKMIKEDPNQYVVYDIGNKGEKFSKQFHAGESKFLAIWSHSKQKFVTEVSEASITRGIVISNASTQILRVSRDLREGYDLLHNESVNRSRIKQEQHIPLFEVEVSDLERLDENRNWQKITPDEYLDHNVDYRPSRGVHATVNSTTFRLGSVVEVPARKGGSGFPRRQKEVLKKNQTNTNTNSPYCERDSEICVEWDNKRKYLMLNINHPTINMLYNFPDEQGSRTQMMLQELYYCLHTFAFGLAKSGLEPATIDYTQVIEGITKDGDPIYHANRWDYAINKSINQFLADSPYVQSLVEKVQSLRLKVSA